MPVPHPAPLSGASYSAVELLPGDDAIVMLDQRRLPLEEHYVTLTSASEVTAAIRDMVVRGAPAIGIAAAYGFAIESRRAAKQAMTEGQFEATLELTAGQLRAARPTAVNLAWAVDEIATTLRAHRGAPAIERATAAIERARQIHRDDVAACKAMGAIGAALLPDEGTILTHCNAGALATGGYGTALGVIRAAIAQGKRLRVFADETRPYLQGARLTTWELARDGIDVELLTDGMSAHFFARGEIAAVVVGADRVALNGDVANKIGTYGVACLARLHDRPFYVAAPISTLDPRTPSGDAIVIEERSSDEVTRIFDRSIAPLAVRARHPGFDVTPARLVTRLITERGAVAGVDASTLMTLAT
ncbi:MAG: S-methyl-5-thioribose-1-phosphate isomerase [Polyangiales bacterium]